MRTDSFDRDRRVAISLIIAGFLTLLVANGLFFLDVPYVPIRLSVLMVGSVTVFATVLWVVARHYTQPLVFTALLAAPVICGLGLLLQLGPVSAFVSQWTGLSTFAVESVIKDSFIQIAMMLLVVVTVSTFITASRTSYTAQQRAAELETTRAALQESEERFRRAFEEGPIGMAMVDAEQKLTRVNRTLCNDLGYREEELIGQSIDWITHPDDREESREVALAIFRGAAPPKYEKRYRKKDGSFFWGSLTARVVLDREGQPFYALGMVENVTRRKEMEAAIERDRQFLRSLLDLQERERRFVAHEIHDGFVQQTVAAKMHLEAYQCGAESGTANARQLALAVESLDGAIREGRRMIGELRPMIIDDGGIVDAIEYLTSDGAIRKGLEVEFVCTARFERLDPLLESTIFRITQEALANVWRHSQSDKAIVRLDRDQEQISLEIQDWGSGFDPDRVDASRFGLRGLEERARLFGGRATIESRPGEGTRIRVVLPILRACQTPVAAQGPKVHVPAADPLQRRAS